MNTYKLTIIVLIMAVFLVACPGKKKPAEKQRVVGTADWPIFRGDAGLSGRSGDTIPDELTLRWSFQTGGEIFSSPVIGSGRIFIGSTDGKVYALRLKDGGKIWEFDAGDDIEASPLLVGKSLYIGSLSGEFFALHVDSGTLNWKYKTEGSIYGSANWTEITGSRESLIFVGSHDNRMYCFEAVSGKLRWTYETDHYINGAPATDGQVIIFGGCDENLHIVNVADGKKLARVGVGSYIPGSAALAGGKAYLGHYGNKLVCIDMEVRKITWEYSHPEHADSFFSSPAVGKEHVVIGSRDSYLHCVNRDTGKLAWVFRTRDEVDSSPVIAGNRVVVGSTDGRLYMVDLQTGRETWSYEIGAAIIGCPALAGGWIAIGSDDGRVYAFGESL